MYRCTLGNNGLITAQDYVILTGYGHGESVEVTEYNSSTSTYTVWIGASGSATNYYWSKDVARVKYKVDSNSTTGATITESKTINNLSGVTGSPDLSFRTSVCVAESDNRICICTQLGNGNGDWYYIVYSLSEINGAVNDMSGNSSSLSGLGVTIKSIFSMTDDGLPNSSFQSIDNDGVGTNNKMLFLAGGGHGDDSKIDQYLYTNGGKITKLYEYIILNTQAPSNDFLYNAEIEGIKIYSDNGVDYIYMMFKQLNATYSRIYRYPVQ